MPRLMSVAYTEAQVLDRTKTVTRRLGWRFAEPGQRVVLCRKVMGRKPGEPLHRLVAVELRSVRRESLGLLNGLLDPTEHGLAATYAHDEVAREGFPGMDPGAFVNRFFCAAQGIRPDAEVARIRWSYLEGACVACGLRDHPNRRCTHTVAVERL